MLLGREAPTAEQSTHTENNQDLAKDIVRHASFYTGRLTINVDRRRRKPLTDKTITMRQYLVSNHISGRTCVF
jgi:hypothetical protein